MSELQDNYYYYYPLDCSLGPRLIIRTKIFEIQSGPNLHSHYCVCESHIKQFPVRGQIAQYLVGKREKGQGGQGGRGTRKSQEVRLIGCGRSLHPYIKKSRIRETPTLSTDVGSTTDKILERLRDLPIRTEKRTWSTQKCGLGPR